MCDDNGRSAARLAGYMLLSLLLVGCGSASDHIPVISGFSDAAEKAHEALVALDRASAERLTMRARAAALAKPVGVRAAENSCTTAATGCTIVVRRSPGDANPLPIATTTLIPNHIAAIETIVRYTDALAAIIAADATPEVKAALNKASASAINIAGLANLAVPGVGAAAAAFAPAVGQAALWLIGRYQEHVKLSALRDATADMEKVLPDAVKLFADAARIAHRARVAMMAQAFEDADRAFRETRNEASLDALIAAAREFDGVLKARPEFVFHAIGDVHKELHGALHAQTATLASALANVDRLAAGADKLVKIGEAFMKAAKPVGTGTP